MKTISQISQLRITGTLIGLLMIVVFLPNAFAEFSLAEEQICMNHNVELKSDQCTELVKRSRLKTKKLVPEVRAEVRDRKKEFEMNALYPFIKGVGGIN